MCYTIYPEEIKFFGQLNTQSISHSLQCQSQKLGLCSFICCILLYITVCNVTPTHDGKMRKQFEGLWHMLNCSLKWWDFVPPKNLSIVILHKTTFTMKAKESSNSKESVQWLNKLRTLFGISLTTTEISSCITARQYSCYLHRDIPMQSFPN